MRRRAVIVLGFVALLCTGALPHASAHAALQSSDPSAGSVLDDAPKNVRLRFSEPPEASLSTVRVADTDGTTYETGPPTSSDDPFTLEVGLRPLTKRVYIITWRAVSAADGHPTAGSFAFGVGVLPDESIAAATTDSGTAFSLLELVGRALFIGGLVALLGTACASIAGFARHQGGGRIGAAALAAAAVGLVLLAEAQRRSAEASFTDLLGTSVGRALAWRALAVAVAGGALLVGQRGSGRARRAAMWVAAIATAISMAVHVDAGHAAGARSWRSAVVLAQWAHFAAIGIWIGGLVVLLVDIRGAASQTKAQAVRRFSTVAAFALVVVVATGVIRALAEVDTWDELLSTGYGRAVVTKSALIAAIAALAAVNRWRNVRRAANDLRPLRRTATAEVALAATALVVAALLAGLSPPAAARTPPPNGLSASGNDFATTVRVDLTTTSPLPGANRFVARVVDFDSRQPIVANGASLRFTALDDPDVAPTTLPLSRGADGTYSALGNNLAFDGRWQIDVQVERSNSTVTVPLILATRRPPQFVSVTRIPGEPVVYTVQIADETLVNFAVSPERSGPNAIEVSFADVISDERAIDRLVLTIENGTDGARQQPVRRLSTGRFVVDVDLRAGHTQVTAIAHTADGTRLWAQFELTIGGG